MATVRGLSDGTDPRAEFLLEQIVDAIWSRVGRRTRALFLSYHTSGTAIALPVTELCRRAREGISRLALRALGADYYAGN